MTNPSIAWHARLAARALKAGETLAYPTESVWGLGCDPANEAAMEQLLEIKKRPSEKGVILIAAGIDQIAHLLAPLPEAMRTEAESLWPGFITCLLPDLDEQIPPWIRGKHGSVAVRVTLHPGVQAICRAFGGPIVSTSCNPAGRPPARTRLEAKLYFNQSVHFMAGSTLAYPRPSPILDLQTGQYLRR